MSNKFLGVLVGLPLVPRDHRIESLTLLLRLTILILINFFHKIFIKCCCNVLIMLDSVTCLPSIFAYSINFFPIHSLLALTTVSDLRAMLCAILSVLCICGSILSQNLTRDKARIHVDILRGVIHMWRIPRQTDGSVLSIISIPASNEVLIVQRGIAVLSTWGCSEMIGPLHLLVNN